MSRLRSCIVIGVVLAVACPVVWLATRAAPTPAAPRLDAKELVELDPHEIGTHAVAEFTLANRGIGVLHLTDFRSSCACNGLERKLDGRYVRLSDLALAAGESVEVRLVLSVRGYVGQSLRSAVFFRTDDPERPEASVVVSIPRLLGGVRAVPANVAVGRVPVGSVVRHVVDIHDASATPRAVTRLVSSDPARITARLLPPSAAAAGAPANGTPIGRVELAVATADAGGVDGEIRVVVSDGQLTPETIRVTGRVVPPVELSPPTLLLPRASADGPLFSASCLVRSSAARPLTLTAADPPAGVTLTVRPADDGPAQLVEVRAAPGKADYIIRLTATVDGRPHPLELPVRVRPADAPPTPGG